MDDNGYGYGVWLVIKDTNILSDIKHIPHVTIMCFMEKEEAIKLYRDIMQSMGITYEINLHNICKLLPNSYDDDEQLYASGFDCYATNWSLFQKICEKYSGSFSYDPHLSYDYSHNITDLKYKNYDNDLILQCELHVVDITHSYPMNWNIVDII